MREIVITGASGFLGSHIVRRASALFPDAELIAIGSPRRGGVDLAAPNAAAELSSRISLRDPRHAMLIHAAAVVEWHKPAGLLANSSMAVNVATWARDARVGFSVLTSSVSVYRQHAAVCSIRTPSRPASYYAIGKMAAEEVWELLLPPEQRAVVRLVGIWGWQQQPAMFWNQLLLSALSGGPPRPVATRRRSRRNYISAGEAAECLLRIGLGRIPGLLVAAGRDTVDTESFITGVERLPGSRLAVEWHDDGLSDEMLYTPSDELLPWLGRFDHVLMATWAAKPDGPPQ